MLATAGENRAITVLKRRGKDMASIVDGLYGILNDFTGLPEEEILNQRREARRIAVKASWETFYPEYLRAFEKALAGALSRASRLGETRGEMRHVFSSTGSNQPHFRTFTAVVNLPQKIIRLRELAYNLWWSWNPQAMDLFSLLDPKLWEGMGNNPVRMLETVSPERLSEAADNESYTNLYSQVLQRFDDYMGERGLAKAAAGLNNIKWSAPVAYFSTEYGIHESLPIYSGGLGVLSGDTLKTASDLNIPTVGVGLLYKCGYFRQVIDKDGIQQAEYVESDFSNMPVQIVQDDRGNEVQISIELPGRTLYASIWEVKMGRISLYLLDTDIARNTVQDRKITARLYTADQRTRIEQEILLGMGGVRLLEKLGIKARVCHINEGHSAFLLFERMSRLMTEDGLSFDEAEEVVRGSTVFTTHTPVEAGNERFSKDLMEYYFAGFVKRMGITWSQFSNLGRKEIGEDRPFFMTNLALKLSHRSNAVSRIHRSVARRMWRDVWKGFHDSDIPILDVTNGVHMVSWVAPRMKEVLDTYLGLDWEKNIGDPNRWKRVYDIPDSVFWRVRYELKQNLINSLREHISRHWAVYGYSKTWREDILGGINPSALWIGFARRFAPYKRADLLFSDLDRLSRIVNHETRPVHIVFAGKAHPNDQMGKDLVHKVVEMTPRRAFPGEGLLRRGLRHRVGAGPCPGRGRLAQQPPQTPGGQRHERHEGGHQRGAQHERLRRLVVRGIRRHQRLEHRPGRERPGGGDPRLRRGRRALPLRPAGGVRGAAVLRPRPLGDPAEMDPHGQALHGDAGAPVQHGAHAPGILRQYVHPRGRAGAGPRAGRLPACEGSGRLEAKGSDAILVDAAAGGERRGGHGRQCLRGQPLRGEREGRSRQARPRGSHGRARHRPARRPGVHRRARLRAPHDDGQGRRRHPQLHGRLHREGKRPPSLRRARAALQPQPRVEAGGGACVVGLKDGTG